MKPQSAKAKGRRLQQEVREAVLGAFPQLLPGDVRSTSMGASGEDLLLSPAALQVFPYDVECKNVEALNIWKALAQADRGEVRPMESPPFPLVVFRRNHSRTYVALEWEHFLDLLKIRAAFHTWPTDG